MELWVKACVGACVCCVGVYLRQHHFKTNSLQRKQSPLDHHKFSMSDILTNKKMKRLTYNNVRYCGVTLCVPGGPSGIFKIRCDICCYFAPSQAQ